ncbi:free fatty acid receptor 2-like [Syngnathus scovelli]|uniref:free fatty acid receptor 2-like n=1 Tax=Syngnathus scovelli TaxID=161590 RepID=UPI0021105AA6|nr:free fatty acid receptor 2-like [Syngnathus scovelli]XP_049586001.1 free fatty acid receptor 2-like [Syngnathus scovelli]
MPPSRQGDRPPWETAAGPMSELALQQCSRSLCLSVYIITFVLGFPANVLAFSTFCSKVRHKATPIDILLLNLTISDLLFLLFLPFKMHEAMNDKLWKMPEQLCPLSGFIFYMTIYNSTFFLTAISVERYLGVAFPIQHSLKRRPLYAVAASVFFWIFSFSHLSIVYIVPFIGTDKGQVKATAEPNSTTTAQKEVCYDNFTDAQLKVLLPVRLELCLVLFCIPFLICSFCYINFIRILSRLQHIDRRRRLRAIGMALGTLLVFAVCFGPYNVSHVVGFVTWQNPTWRDEALLCSTFNACLDPLIFYVSSSAVRGTVGNVMEGARAHLSRCLPRRPPWKQATDDKESKQDQINAS